MKNCVAICLVVILLRAIYTPMKGSDPEYGQGAIERCELPHREITSNIWLVHVPSPGDPTEWQRHLNDAVDPKHGSFKVQRASEEEERRVARGEIRLQK